MGFLLNLFLKINLIILLTYGVSYQNLQPSTNTILSVEDINTERISIDFDTNCLGTSDPQEEIDELLILYPCLSQRWLNNGLDYFYNKRDQMSRVYFNLETSQNCLNNYEIVWDDYCILYVNYEIMYHISNVNSIETINNITYNETLEAKAWQLDFLDGVENDNLYRHYNGMELFGDREIDIWILDTGVFYLHKEFFDGQVIREDLNFTWGDPHGTGTAACAGGINYGVAKNFQIHDYPVCQYGGSCASSDIMAGLQTALNYLIAGKGKRSVINMSLGTSISDANYFSNMFDDITNSGGIVVVAAGNWDDDACLHNYAYYNDIVIAVGAHNASKSKSSYSSYGNCVTLYAPGDNVATAYSDTNPYTTQYKSGTSFSSPITAGKIANLLHENPTLSRNNIVNILTTQNLYPINGCTSGFCYGSYHNFSYNSNFIPGNYLKFEQIIPVSISTVISTIIQNNSGIYSQIYVNSNAIINGFSIRIDIIHQNRSNLILTLISPTSISVRLNASNSLDNEPNIDTIFFPTNFNNTNMVGTWTLNVLDYVGKYTGRLNYWNMKFYTHSTVINVTTTTLASAAASNCTCKGSRKCTAYTNTLDCTPSNGACYWNC